MAAQKPVYFSQQLLRMLIGWYSEITWKCMQLPTILVKFDRPTNQPTHRPTDGQTGSKEDTLSIIMSFGKIFLVISYKSVNLTIFT